MARKLTPIQQAGRALKEAQERLDRAKQDIYRNFRSATSLGGIPSGPAVSTNLTSKWCNYDGYCTDVELAYRLLEEFEAVTHAYKRAWEEREIVLAPYREAREKKRAKQQAKKKLDKIEAAQSEPLEYVGTVPGALGKLDQFSRETQRIWRQHLMERGKNVPDVPLVNGGPTRQGNRYKIFALGVVDGFTLDELATTDLGKSPSSW